MELLKKITKFVSKYMAVIVIAVAALALFAPNTRQLYQNQLRQYTAWNRNVWHGTYPEAK